MSGYVPMSGYMTMSGIEPTTTRQAHCHFSQLSYRVQQLVLLYDFKMNFQNQDAILLLRMLPVRVARQHGAPWQHEQCRKQACPGLPEWLHTGRTTHRHMC